MEQSATDSSPPIPNQQPFSPPPQLSRKFFLLLTFIVLLALVGGSMYLLGKRLVAQQLQMKSQTTQITYIPSPTFPQETSIPTISPGKVIAINKKDPDFSFKFPHPQYCQGCFDGLGGAPPGYRSGTITNQASDYKMPATENWVIQYVTVKQGAKVVGGDFTIPTSSFFDTLVKLNVNETTQIVDDLSHKSYSFTRLKNKTIDGVIAHIYQSNMTTGHGTQTKYAIFTKGDYLYSLSVEWASDIDKSIFDLVTSSFQFSLRPKSEVIPY